jgi:hypothetical protein
MSATVALATLRIALADLRNNASVLDKAEAKLTASN